MTLTEVLAEIRDARWRWYVYIIGEPGGSILYVGKGTRGRVAAHEAEALGKRKPPRGSQCHKRNVLASVVDRRGRLDYSIDSFHVEQVSAMAREVEVVAGIGRADLGRGPLLNMSDGGENANCEAIAAAKRAWHQANPERSREIATQAASVRGPEWRAANAEGQRKWNRENPEAAQRRIERRTPGVRLAHSSGRVKAGQVAAYAADPSIRTRQSASLKAWHAAHPEHLRGMVERAAAVNRAARTQAVGAYHARGSGEADR